MRIEFSNKMRFQDDPGDFQLLPKKIVVYSGLPFMYKLLVLIHELAEMNICIFFGLNNDIIDAIDMEKRKGVSNYDRYKYDLAHNIATSIENVFVRLFGLSLYKYDKYIDELEI